MQSAILDRFYTRTALKPHPIDKDTLEKVLQNINGDPEKAYNFIYLRYVDYHGNYFSRIPEIEAVIVKSEWYSYLYADEILDGRFIEGEDVISTDLRCSYKYAAYALKGKDKVDTSIKPIQTILNETSVFSYYGAPAYIIHLGMYIETNGLTKKDIDDFKKQAEYIRGLKKYMEVPEIEDIDDEEIKV